MATISKENYLKAIYGLTSLNGERIPASSLAQELEVSNAAVTEMANKLSKQGFIDYEKYRGIKILEKGRKLAINVLRKHRLWEIFLIETLGLNWGEVHDEAERLEHGTTNFLIDKIDEYLDYPKADPHGAPVPNKDGSFRTEITDFPMADCKKGQSYKISRVRDKNIELIKYLSQINISLNKKIIIEDKLSFDNSIIVSIEGVKHSLSEKLVEHIFLSEIKS
jgi:DtxR family Mn-dependent transcriptional regulator